MPDTKISALTPGAPAVSTDQLPVRRGVGNVSLLLSDLLTLFSGAPGPIGGTTPSTGAFTTVTLTSPLPVASGGTGVAASTGTGNNVLATSPVLITPALGTPLSGILTNATGLPLTTGVTGTLPQANGGTGQISLFGAVNLYTKNQTVTPSALTSGASVAVDASLSNNFKLVLGINATLANPTNLSDGMVLNFRIKQDATGSRTLAYGTAYKFPGGTAAVLSTAANAVDLMSCYYDSTDGTLACNMNKAFA